MYIWKITFLLNNKLKDDFNLRKLMNHAAESCFDF